MSELNVNELRCPRQTIETQKFIKDHEDNTSNEFGRTVVFGKCLKKLCPFWHDYWNESMPRCGRTVYEWDINMVKRG